jgi:(R,R)-butanediol dehydrogenase/meso-butanediol dehydrogenase/diacetyl reductase
MLAARYYQPGDIRIEQLPEPEPGARQVKIGIAFNGLCGTDLHEYFDAAKFVATSPHPLTGASAPVVFGHEFSGTIVALGAESKHKVGERVAVRPSHACGTCPACERGLRNLCRNAAFHGLSADGGGLAEFTVVDDDMAHVLPDGVSLEMGALVEPMAVAYHAVVRSGIGPGDLAVVSGLGAIGIGVWFALRARGVDRIILSNRSAPRRAVVEALGALNVIDPRRTDLAVLARQLSAGAGADVVFEAAGTGEAIEMGVQALAPRGKLVILGIHERPMQFDPTSLIFQEVSLMGSLVYDDSEFDEVIAAMARGDYDLTGWVSHAPLVEVESALNAARTGQSIKVLVGS